MKSAIFSKMIVAYDGTDGGDDLLTEAVDLATANNAEVHLVSVVHLLPGEILAEAAYPTGLIVGHEKEMRQSLEDEARAFRDQGCQVSTHLIVDNNPAAAIRELALHEGADLIVLGHRPRGPFSRLWNGSVGLALLSNPPCSILVAVGTDHVGVSDSTDT